MKGLYQRKSGQPHNRNLNGDMLSGKNIILAITDMVAILDRLVQKSFVENVAAFTEGKLMRAEHRKHTGNVIHAAKKARQCAKLKMCRKR